MMILYFAKEISDTNSFSIFIEILIIGHMLYYSVVTIGNHISCFFDYPL